MTVATGLPHPIDTSRFRQVASRWASGCAVVTTADAEGTPFGATITAMASLSLHPMQFLVCLDRRARTLAALRGRKAFVINILGAGQADLARRFAGRAADKFAGLACEEADGLPILPGTLAHIACKVARITDGGDHEIVIGNVVRLAVGEGEPLIHYHGGFGRFIAEP